MQISIDPELAGKLLLGVLRLEGVSASGSGEALAAEIRTHCERLRRQHEGKRSAEVPGVSAARSLYRSLGIDPTKTRPSNEALLRRVLKGEALYRINTLVDALNLCSLRQQLPYGLYDLDRLRGAVLLRTGLPGESYEGIRKGQVNVAARPVLVDEQGPFGNPTSDSARTRITDATRNALVTAYAPLSLGRSGLRAVLVETAETLMAFCGGHVAEQAVLPGGSQGA